MDGNKLQSVAAKPETEAERQRRLAAEADAEYARTPGRAERLHQATLRGLADVDAGRLIDDEKIQAWLESLGTDHELPPPEPD
ncbi:MAG TPA: CopG family transcriptional regulator [Acidisphaera sp.]|nr:CopG family transcriptional regulator [Acidisphaera sp.]